MHWKAYIFLKDHEEEEDAKDTYEFKSKRPSPHMEKEFEDSILDMIVRIEFQRKTSNKTISNKN